MVERERAARGAEKGPRVGLKASLDTPKPDQTLPRSEAQVSGWAVHRDRYIRGFLIELDGVPVAVAPPAVSRSDVAAAYPEHTDSPEIGFAAIVDLTRHEREFATLTVSVILGPLKQSDPRLGTPPLHKDSRVVPMSSVTCRTTSAMARMSTAAEIGGGWQRWGGVADVPSGVARVDMLMDGLEIGRARIALPGQYDAEVRSPESRIGRFEIAAPLPTGRESVCLGARVTAVDGTVTLAPDVEVAVGSDRVEARLTAAGGHPVTAVAASRIQPRGVTKDGELRAVVLTHDLGLGGAQLFLSTLLDRLHELGVWCAVASHQDGPLRARLEGRGWPVLVTGQADFSSSRPRDAQTRRLQAWISQHGCSVALANTALTFPEVETAQELGLGVVWALHESYSRERFWLEFSSERAPDPTFVRSFDRALASADRVVFVSEATRALYRDRIADSAGVVVRYGIDMTEVDDYRTRRSRQLVREELGYSESTRLLLCLGIVTPLKGQIALAQAFTSSSALRETDVALAFVGSTGGPYADGLRQYVEATGDPRIRIVALDPDSYRWHVASDVLVSGSDNESMPRTMIEAMAFERPVAGPAVFGVPELVEDGVTGFLCEPNDIRELRGLLEKAGTADKEELARMGQQARKAVEARNDAMQHARYFDSELRRLAQ